MSDDADDVERVAQELIERFGSGAVNIAREQVEAAASAPDAQAWRDIADAIERLSRKRRPRKPDDFPRP
jgi:hypothetical protein